VFEHTTRSATLTPMARTPAKDIDVLPGQARALQFPLKSSLRVGYRHRSSFIYSCHHL
jgi:hypothetical protein